MKNTPKKFDLHVHSHFSIDAYPQPDNIIQKAKNRNLGLAIADHNQIAGSLQASHQKEVIVIPAIETLTADGIHALFLFEQAEQLQKFYNNLVKPCIDLGPCLNLTVLELIKKARAYHCLVGWPHPFETRKGGCYKLVKNGLVKESDLISIVDFIETKNASAKKSNNELAKQLAEKYGKPQTAGSDSHLLYEIGTAYTIIEADNIPEVLEKIAKGQTAVAGRETQSLSKNFGSVLKEGRTILRKNGLKILKDQLKRRRS